MRWLAALFIYMAAVGVALGQTAIRPDQISPKTPDITWAPGGTGYQIGSTIPWRADTCTSCTFTSTDAAKTIELTGTAPITATLPDTATTGTPPPFGDGFGFAIQTKAQPLTVNPTGTQKINGQTSVKVGPYQLVSLASRGGNWYATFSIPQPSAQTRATVLADDMTWITAGTSGGGGTITLAQAGVTSQGGASPVTTWSTTINGTTAGNLLTVEVVTFTAGGTISSVTASAGTCSLATGASGSSANSVAAIYYCPNTPGGNITITANFAGPNHGFPFVNVQEWSGALTSGVDAGLGNSTGGGTLSAATLTLTPNQTNSLIISAVAPNATPTSVGVGTFTDSSKVSAYSLVDTSGTAVTHTYNFSPAATYVAGVIAAFKHP